MQGPQTSITPEGKRLLLAAAAKLSALHGSPHKLVLREVAREAGLNHNTFYRHFADMDSMMKVMAEDFAAQVRHGVRQARANAKPGLPLSAEVLGWIFDQAARNADLFTVSLRELHGPAGPLRDVVRRLLADLAEDMCEDLQRMPGLQNVDLVRLRGATDLLIRNAVWLCLDYLEHPEQRQALLGLAHEAFSSIITGVIARSSLENE
jgi:AcrR family transcriptional regulator